MAEIPSRSDLVGIIRELERRVEDLESTARLTSASIGEGGITIKGGSLTIEDSNGNIIADLGTGGLQIENDGELVWIDSEGNTRVLIAADVDVGGSDTTRMEFRDAAGTGRVAIGEIRDQSTGALRGTGMLIEDAAEADVFTAYEGKLRFFDTGAGGASFLYMERDQDDEIDLSDSSNTFRASLGPIVVGGVTDYGLIIELANGNDVLIVHPDEITLSDSDAGRPKFRVKASDGSTNGYNPWIEVETTGGTRQNGLILCGAADSAGTGYRTLMIPN